MFHKGLFRKVLNMATSRETLQAIVTKLASQKTAADDPGTAHPAKAEPTGGYPEGPASAEMTRDVKDAVPATVEDGVQRGDGASAPNAPTATEVGDDPATEDNYGDKVNDPGTSHPAKTAQDWAKVEGMIASIRKEAAEHEGAINLDNAVATLGQHLCPAGTPEQQKEAADKELRSAFAAFSKSASLTSELAVDDVVLHNSIMKVAEELGVGPDMAAQAIDQGAASPETGELSAEDPEAQELLAAIAQFAEAQGVPLEQVIQMIESGELPIEQVLGMPAGGEEGAPVGAEGEASTEAAPAPAAEEGVPAAGGEETPEDAEKEAQIADLKAKLELAEKKAAYFDQAMTDLAEAERNDKLAQAVAAKLQPKK